MVNVQMCKCENVWLMCKCENVQMDAFVCCVYYAFNHLHICTFSHLHINHAFAH